MSQQTDSENPNRSAPHKVINKASSGSSAFHFRCRWRCKISLSAKPIPSARRGRGRRLGLFA